MVVRRMLPEERSGRNNLAAYHVLTSLVLLRCEHQLYLADAALPWVHVGLGWIHIDAYVSRQV